MELNKIYNQDCLEFMEDKFEKKVVDMIVTSPPYNIGKDYENYKDDRTKEDYLDWMEQVAKQSLSILKDNGSFFLNVGFILTDPTRPLEILDKFQKAGYKLQNTFIWLKSMAFAPGELLEPNEKGLAAGHYQPVKSDRFSANLFEYIFHFTKTGNVKVDKLAIGVPYQDKSNIPRWESTNHQDLRDRGNVWFIPYETIKERRPHPAPFPEKLPETCIKYHGITKDMLVYDPFMGVGSTALACINLGVQYIGSEINEGYIEIAQENLRRRVGVATNKTPLHPIILS